MTDYSKPATSEETPVRGAVDDVIIIPIVFVTLAANKILYLFLLILMRLLDYAFPVALKIAWLPLFAARVFGNIVVMAMKGTLLFLPISDSKRRQWRKSIGQGWSWLRRKFSYRSFERAVHNAFENGMAWVFRNCRDLTPSSALLVILGAAIWLPISFGAATAMHAVLLAKVSSWPAWVQLLHPLATVIAKSKLLVLPVYPAAWPQARRHALVQIVFKIYKAITSLYVVRKFHSRYRRAELAGLATLEVLERTTGFTSAIKWLRKAHVPRRFGVRKSTHKMRSFFSRWSIKFSPEYYENRERLGSGLPSKTIRVTNGELQKLQ
jgi:hypothetical protein